MRWRAGLVVGFAIGYVCGARAGRESYERLMAQARGIMGVPPPVPAAPTGTEGL